MEELLEKVEKLTADKTKDEKKIKTLEKELEDIQTEVQDTTGFILEWKKDKEALEENLKTVEKSDWKIRAKMYKENCFYSSVGECSAFSENGKLMRIRYRTP